MQRRRVRFAVIPFACGLAALLTGLAAGARQPSDGPRALDVSAPVPYFIAAGSPETGYRASDRQLARWALNAWRTTIGNGLRLEASPESSALIRLYWAEPNETQYGEMRPLTVGGRRGAAVYIRPDVDALGPDIAARARGDALFRDTIVYLTCLHELGHAFGLTHTSNFRDIMYFFGYGGDIVEYFDRYRRQLRSTSDIATTSGISTGDAERARALYAR
jgi:hypothetical protein